MSYHFIVSIGTSLISNYEKNHGAAGFLEEVESYSFEDLFKDGQPLDFNELQSKIALLRNIEEFKDDKCQGAEQKSAGKVIEEKKIDLSDVWFHLIATRTGEGAACAGILKEIWKENRVNVHFPPGFGKADESGFADTGLPNLLNEIAAIMKGIEEKKQQGLSVEAIIIPTGGYKAIIPYLTIASILYGYPAYYIYEDSDTLVELPAPPLGVDIAGFRATFSLLENIVGVEKGLARPYWDELNLEFQKLLFFDSSTKKYAYTAFGERLREMYLESKEGELVVKASQNRLINKLPEPYRVDFRKLVQLGPSVWLGDKALEMADHARYHHLNLFSYAELFLSPILRQRKTFLSSEELMLLLGMIYLHDCGHTMTELPQGRKNGGYTPLLHWEIRNFHNLLGYYRIKSELFQESLKRQGVKLDHNFFEAVAFASLYHRKKMPLLNNPYTGPDGQERLPLSGATLKYGDSSIDGNRCALVGALFRIIDGMDKQVARAGDLLEIVMKAESILAELPGLWRKAAGLGACLEHLAPGLTEVVDEFIKKMLGKYIDTESPAARESNNGRTCDGWGCADCPKISPESESEESTYQEQAKALERKRRHIFPLFWEYLTIRSRFSFLAMQPFFYYTDVLLATPKVSHWDDHNAMVFTIDYQESSGKAIVDCRKKLENIWCKIGNMIDNELPCRKPEKKLKQLQLECPEKIVSGVRDEYCSEEATEVAQILYQHNIKVLFRYNGSNVPCWKEKTA